MKKSSKVFVGMDVHKESIDMTVAEVGGEVRRWGQIGGDRAALGKAVRNLVRSRDDAIIAQRRARQQLQALLLRNEIRYVGKCAWTQAHRRWIAQLKLPQPVQRIAFEEYVDAVEVASSRIDRLTRAIEQAVEGWRFAPVVKQLQALRGVQFVHAVSLLSELGDLARFTEPRQLMACLGLVPTENSSGERRRQGAITKSGNRFARRALIEAAWAYQHPARVTPIIARRQTGLPKAARDIAWKAQLRLCGRFRKLCARKLNKNKVVVAIARELSGFVWAIAKDVKIA